MGDRMQRKDEEKVQDPERLAALQRAALLDTPPEEAFDRLTRLATTLLRVPVALVSLVDGNRQFFKSCVGLPEPLASLRQTPLTHSFCKHVVASGEPLIVPDIRSSDFKNGPSVFGIGEIAYTGIPLTTTEGHALGSFCVVDTSPRTWTDEELEILRCLAASVMTEIELRELSNDLQRLVEERTSQLSRAEERWRVLLQLNNALVTCLDRETLLEAIAGALRGVIPYDRMALALDDPVEFGEGLLSVLSVPLRSNGRVIGTLNVGSREVGRYDESQSELFVAIADQVVLAIRNMLAYEEVASLKHRLEQENLYLQEESRAEAPFADVVGESAGIRKVLAKIRIVAGTDSTVLVTGETGTGKELVVRAIHELSRRKDKILVKVNCAALPSGVIESELFGHEKGAFTGALTRRVGRFELAHGGTLFLDEIGDLPLELQAKLLRVLQEGEFERVGGTQTLKVNIRLVAATNRDLVRAVEDGRFRADLFYRLHVFPIAIPPLRDRVEDVPRLVRHFAMLYASKMGKPIETISERAMDKLTAYHWPGNVRELQNVVERAVILSTRGRIELDDQLAPPVGGARPKAAATLEEIERDHILSVLERVGWRVGGERGAARILGLKRTTLEARMGKLGIARPS
jgi:formate hydrogenlyase transcriptional activator